MCAQPKRALIFVNGSLPDPEKVRFLLEPEDWLVAVDGGWYHLKALGLRPHLLIGDLDSVAAEDAAALEAEGVEIRRFPVHKDETDLELALLAVRAAGVATLRVAAALGGRLDQTLANLSLLLLPELEDCDVRLDDGQEEVFLIRKRAEIHGQAGDGVSLLPILGPARGVTTAQLAYPLRAETLFPQRTRGISNVMESTSAAVSVQHGVLLCIHMRKSQSDSHQEQA